MPLTATARRRSRGTSAALCAALVAAARAAPEPPAETTGQVGEKLARCGVATAAIYFPGFHRSVENNRFWGENWTEWCAPHAPCAHLGR